MDIRKIVFLLLPFAFIHYNAQVGINTTTPQTTLDVNGNVIVRTVQYSPPAASYEYLVRNSVTNVVEKVSGNLGSVSVNPTIAKIATSSTTGLLQAGFYPGYSRINFETADVAIDKGSNVNVVDDTYTVPSTGVYAINYSYSYGNGVQLQLLSLAGNPNLAILRQTGAIPQVVDAKNFSGANVSLMGIGALSVVISQASINSVYQLAAGDILSFEVFEGGIDVGVLGVANASISIYKISD